MGKLRIVTECVDDARRRDHEDFVSKGLPLSLFFWDDLVVLKNELVNFEVGGTLDFSKAMPGEPTILQVSANEYAQSSCDK